MKSSKEIKDKVLIIFKALLGDKGRTLWILAIVGGFFAANLRQNGRLSLIQGIRQVLLKHLMEIMNLIFIQVKICVDLCSINTKKKILITTSKQEE